MIDEKYKNCINACLACIVTCNQCATACLNEESVNNMAKCIQLDLECAALCRAAAEIMSLNGQNVKAICRLCAEICTTWAEECEKHGKNGMQHCKECAEACRKCAEECSRMAA